MTAFPKPTPREKAKPAGLRRGKPMRRTWMKRRRPRRLDTSQSNPAFIHWLHGEPCCADGMGPCSGPPEAHHAGPKPGMGMKAPDKTAVRLCRGHHHQLTNRRGPFSGKTREEMRAIQDDWIAATWGRWLSHGARRST